MRLILRLHDPDGTIRPYQESAIAPQIGDVIVEPSGAYTVLDRRISFETELVEACGLDSGPIYEEVTVVDLSLGDRR